MKRQLTSSRRLWLIAVASALLLLTILGSLINEGVVSVLPGVEDDNQASWFVWREQCSSASSENHDSRPRVSVIADEANASYLSSRIGGAVRLSFSEYFVDCAAVGFDMSRWGLADHVEANVSFYEPLVQGEKPRAIMPGKTDVQVEGLGDGAYRVTLPEGRDVATLEIKASSLFERSGVDEFFFFSHFQFLAETFRFEEFRTSSANDALLYPHRLDGAPSQVVAIGQNPTTNVQSPSFGQTEAVTTVQLKVLQSTNNFVSIALVILLGLWIGIIFESVLALTILAELREVLSEARGEFRSDRGSSSEREDWTSRQRS